MTSANRTGAILTVDLNVLAKNFAYLKSKLNIGSELIIAIIQCKVKSDPAEFKKWIKDNNGKIKFKKYDFIAIKKLLLWKSNKEKTSDYPSYLCYYLDFSESRKDPIKRKIYPFEDEKIGLTHFKNLLDENVKKGWEKYNGS